MAATYSTDLVDIALGETGETWTEPTGATGGGVPSPDTDYFIQGGWCATKSMAIAGGGLGGLGTQAASAQTITTPAAVFVWIFFGCPNTLDTQANGGLRVIVGQNSTNYSAWYVRGSDTYTYGGWVCIPVDLSVSSQATQGTPNGTYQYFGTVAKTLATISKGNPFGTDAIRRGRTLQIVAGDVNSPGTFSEAAAKNDANNVTDGYNRWGLFQAIDGGYLQQGLFLMGTSGTAVYFNDSNKSIVIANTIRVVSAFNTFEVRNASSTVKWTNISISALGSTSKGTLTITDNADVDFDGCSFNDMNTFSLQANSTLNNCTWRRCAQITANGATITNSSIENYTGSSDTSALVWNTATDPNGKLDGTTFFKNTETTHAIEFGTSSPLTMTLTDVTFSGYNGSNGQTDSAIHIKRTTGTVTINITGGTSPSYKTDGATVVIVAGSVTVTLTAQTATGTTVSGVSIFVKASDNTGPFPYQASVTQIVNSGTTATVTHTNHGLATNDKVYIQGASLDANLGVFTITITDTNTYTYTMSSSPGSSPTGTITSTFVILNGTTDGNGQITMSRVFPSNQPFTGWGRKSTSAPYYKEGIVTGTVSNSTGATPVALMVLDE